MPQRGHHNVKVRVANACRVLTTNSAARSDGTMVTCGVVTCQGGTARGELPADLQAALEAGRLPLDVLRRYLQLVSVPVLGAMCRAFPGALGGTACTHQHCEPLC